MSVMTIYDNEWQHYLRWREQQCCVDCGKRFADKGAELWATETQCGECFSTLGRPEKRGKPGSMDLYDGNLHILQGKAC